MLVYQSIPESDSGCFEVTAWSTKPFFMQWSTASYRYLRLGDEKRDFCLVHHVSVKYLYSHLTSNNKRVACDH